MTFQLSPTTVAPLASFTASGRAKARTATRIRVDGVLALSFTTGGSGKFSRTLAAPAGPDREVPVVLQQRRSDGVWPQVASAKLLLVTGDGGGTTPPPPPADTAPPIIGTPSHSAITQTSITIGWTTNEAATGQIEYGVTTNYGQTTTLDSSLTSSKSQTISSLVANTVYYYRILARDAATNLGTRTGSFTTAAAPPSPPAAPTGLTATPGNTTVTLNWNAIPGCTYKVYRSVAGGAYSLRASPSSASFVDTGLTNGTLHGYKVSAVNGGGEGAQSSAVTATPTAPPGDTTPPVLTNVAAFEMTQSTAKVSWNLNEPATGQVQYGTTTAYGSLTTLEPGYLLSHIQNISGLAANTLYHYRAKSVDAAGNIGYSSDKTFTTNATPPPGPVPPDTFSGDASGTTDVTAALNAWVASRPAGAASLAANGIYRISNPIRIARNDLEIVGQGAQTRYLSYASCGQSNWLLTGHDIILRDLTAKGAHPAPGTYHEYCEWSHGFEVVGGYQIELDACHSLNNRGDGLYVTSRGHHINWHDGSCRFNGRMGVAVVDGDDILVEDMAFERIAYSTLDCEPNPGSGQSVARVEMRRTTTNWVRSQFFASYGYGPMDDITVEDNTVTGAPFGIWSAVGRSTLRMSNVIFRDNHGDTAFYGGDGAVFSATNVDTLTVTNNSNPVTPGQGMVFLKTTGCTGVTNSGNVLA